MLRAESVAGKTVYVDYYNYLIIKNMTQSEIKFNTIKLINGIKYISKNQINDCKAYVRHVLNLENTDENNNAIEEAIKLYFEQPV